MEEYNFNSQYETSSSKPITLSKIFGFLFLGLALTAGVTYGIYFLLLNSVLSVDTYTVLLYGSLIATIIVSFVVQFKALKNSLLGTTIGYIVYCVLWGIILSLFTIIFDFKTLGLTFLASSASFGSMALYGVLTKRNTASLGMFGTGLLIGAIIMTLVNYFIGSESLFYIISYVIIAAMLLIVAWEVNQAKFMTDAGLMTSSMAIYFAFRLYADFITIFIRLAYIIGLSNRR